MDIVGYPQLPITQQSEQIETLWKIVRGTTPIRAAEAEGKLLRLPAGDGGALVFRTTPEARDPIRNRPDFQQLLSGLEQIGP
jgi:hypothetical protein